MANNELELSGLTSGEAYSDKELVTMVHYVARKRALPTEDFWELVSEVWVDGRFKKSPKEFVFRSIQWAISSYRQRKYFALNENKRKVRCPSLFSSLESYDDSGELQAFDHEDVNNDRYVDDHAFEALVDDYTAELGRDATLVLKLRYIDCLDWKSIGRAVGCGKGTAGYIHNRAINIIREKAGVFNLPKLPANSNEKSYRKPGKTNGRYSYIRSSNRCARGILLKGH